MERSAWTDARLDDRFDRIDGELAELRSDVRELRTEMRQGFAELRGEMDGLATELRGEMAVLGAELRGEMAGLRSTMMRLYGAQLAATFGLIAAILIRGG